MPIDPEETVVTILRDVSSGISAMNNNFAELKNTLEPIVQYVNKKRAAEDVLEGRRKKKHKSDTSEKPSASTPNITTFLSPTRNNMVSVRRQNENNATMVTVSPSLSSPLDVQIVNCEEPGQNQCTVVNVSPQSISPLAVSNAIPQRSSAAQQIDKQINIQAMPPKSTTKETPTPSTPKGSKNKKQTSVENYLFKDCLVCTNKCVGRIVYICESCKPNLLNLSKKQK